MIASNDESHIGSHPIHDTVRIGAVSNQIATTDDAVVQARGAAQYGLERLPICMDVAEDQEAHSLRREPGAAM